MQLKVAEILADALDGEVREDYSGRGMYGETTAAVVFDGSMADLTAALYENADAIAAAKEVRGLSEREHFRADSMGRSSTVVY